MANLNKEEFPEEHLGSSIEIDLNTVKERAVKGIVFLAGRTFFLQILSLIAVSFLTVFLSPSDLGLFWFRYWFSGSFNTKKEISY